MTATADIFDMSKVVASMGSENFAPALMHCLGRSLAFSQLTAFELPAGGPPCHLLADGSSDNDRRVARSLSERYSAEGYVQDNYIQRIRADERAAAALIEVNRRSVFEIDELSFREIYYAAPRLQEEITITRRMGGRLLYIGLYRSDGQQMFDLDEMRAVQALSPFVVESIAKHFELETTRGLAPVDEVATSKDRRKALMQRVFDSLQRDAGGLTQREAEVCSHIVVGYTTTGIARCLNISENTVATHRKRAYAKLRISAQSELFGRYIHLGT